MLLSDYSNVIILIVYKLNKMTNSKGRIIVKPIFLTSGFICANWSAQRRLTVIRIPPDLHTIPVSLCIIIKSLNKKNTLSAPTYVYFQAIEVRRSTAIFVWKMSTKIFFLADCVDPVLLCRWLYCCTGYTMFQLATTFLTEGTNCRIL